ncbi:ABC transporter substrate-binding protein [Aeromicrobium sp. CF4.19]|uniref:taurine ABC transporter substrate-binding protein n=1 Tax=Aeromicrobium sp. CF4.19 TaxID=3373082 RepID=UPI003EE7AF3E
MNTHISSRRIALAACLLVPMALAGCVSSDRSQSGGEQVEDCPWEADDSIDSSVTIGWQRIPNGDLIVQDQGLLEACMPNATISWTAYDSGADVVKAYSAGSIDLALIGNSPTTTAISPNNELDVDVVWIHDVIGEAESLIVKDEADTSLEDLRGKTIGTPEGSTAHYSLIQALIEADMDPSNDVNVINLQPDAMPAAWSSGDVDAAWVWDPTQAKLLSSGGARIMSSADTAEAGFPTYDLGTASSAFVEENPDFMAQWGKAQDHAVSMIKDDPEAAAEIIGAVLTLPAEDVAQQLEGYTYLNAEEQTGPDYLGGGMADDLTSTASFLVDQGSISSALSDEEYADRVDAGPAEEGAK